MCLILFSYRQHPAYPLILAANRDEYLDRPAMQAAFWEEHPGLLAGKDVRAGGTWMGVTRNLRFAALTNFRDPDSLNETAPSRGHIVLDFLTGEMAPEQYLDRLQTSAAVYNGFNLLVGSGEALWYYSNVDNSLSPLTPGLYGLSNHLLDTPWPKVKKGKRRLESLLQREAISTTALIDLLGDTTLAPDEALPRTGVSLEWERLLSAMCIQAPNYGTRVSTALIVDHKGKVSFAERTLGPGNESPVQVNYEFET